MLKNLQNNNVLISGIALSLYIVLVLPKLSLKELSVLDNLTMRLGLIVLISLVCLVSPIIAIMLAICFVITLQKLKTLRQQKGHKKLDIIISHRLNSPSDNKNNYKQLHKFIQSIKVPNKKVVKKAPEVTSKGPIKGYKTVLKEAAPPVKPLNINIGEYLNTDSGIDNKDIYLSQDNVEPHLNNVLNSKVVENVEPKVVTHAIKQEVFTSDSQFNDISSDLVNCKVSDKVIRTQSNQYSAQGFGNNPGVPSGYCI